MYLSEEVDLKFQVIGLKIITNKLFHWKESNELSSSYGH